MSEESATNLGAGGEQASPAPTPEVAPTANAEASTTPDASDDLPPELAQFAEQPKADEDVEEVSWEDGKSYKVPKALKDALLRHADYTRKTQDLAEQKRAVERDREMVAQRAQAQQKFLGEVAQLHALDNQLKQYQQVNFDQLSQENPVEALRLSTQFQKLQAQRGQLAHQVQQKMQQAAREQQQALEQQRHQSARQIEERDATLRREVKDWDKVYPDLVKFAGNYGISKEVLDSTPQPGALKILHLASLGEKLIKEKVSAATAKKAAKAEPVSQVGGGGQPPGVGLRDDLSTEEWMKRRAKQRAG